MKRTERLYWRVGLTPCVDTNNGDCERPNIRSRYVGRDLKANSIGDYETPPLQCHFGMEPENTGVVRRTILVDIKRAQFCVSRELPEEMENMCGIQAEIVEHKCR